MATLYHIHISIFFSISGCHSPTFVNLTDEDTNAILTDNTNRAIQGNVAMQVAQPGGQVCNLYKWRHLMVGVEQNQKQRLPVNSGTY